MRKCVPAAPVVLAQHGWPQAVTFPVPLALEALGNASTENQAGLCPPPVSVEGCILRRSMFVAHYETVGVLTGSWCSWPGSASASVPWNITSSSLPTKENLFSSFLQIFNSSHGPL